jgi:hypothetical protein
VKNIKNKEKFMNKMNEQLYRANIELVDKNKLLEEDKKILTKRIDSTIKMLEDFKINSQDVENQWAVEICNIIIKSLKGRYIEND